MGDFVKECDIPAWKNLENGEISALMNLMEKMGLSRDIPFTRSWTVLGLYQDAQKQLDTRRDDSLLQEVKRISTLMNIRDQDVTSHLNVLAEAILKWRKE